MGRMSDLAMNEQRIKFEIAEAEFLALPKAQVQTLDGINDLMKSHKDLLSLYEKQTSGRARWKERGIGFISGVLASLITAMIL